MSCRMSCHGRIAFTCEPSVLLEQRRQRPGNGRRRQMTVRAIKSEELVLAIDVGTGGTKAALVGKLGNVVASAFHRHPDPSPSLL